MSQGTKDGLSVHRTPQGSLRLKRASGPPNRKDKPMTINLAIILDNIGGNDPEVQMTACMWIAKAIGWIF
jgi:hypothetical protein